MPLGAREMTRSKLVEVAADQRLDVPRHDIFGLTQWMARAMLAARWSPALTEDSMRTRSSAALAAEIANAPQSIPSVSACVVDMDRARGTIVVSRARNRRCGRKPGHGRS